MQYNNTIQMLARDWIKKHQTIKNNNMKRKSIISLSMLAISIFFSGSVLNANTGISVTNEKYSEKEIMLEDWMFKLTDWNLETSDVKTEDTKTEGCEVSEGILVTDSLLKVLTEPSMEDEIKLESWMNDLSQW